MSEEKYIQLDRYFRQEMTAKEKAALRAALASDEALAAEFELRRLAAGAFRLAEVERFRQRHGGTVAPAAKVVRLRWRKWAAAAAVLLLAGLSAWLFSGGFGSDAKRFYAKYDLPELYPEARYALVDEGFQHKGIIGASDFDQLKKDGLKAYQNKDWDAVIRLLAEYLENAKPTDEETPDEINLANLYIGRAWLEKDQPKKAIAALQRADAGVVDLMNYRLLQELIRWQLVLAHLKNNDLDAAKATAETLREARHNKIRPQAINFLNEFK